MRVGSLRLASSILFILVGVLMSAWATIAPYSKIKIAASDTVFGSVILCMGLGSVVAMQITGALLARWSERSIAWASVLLLLVSCPCLALAPNALSLAAALFVFGGGLGSFEILMNHQAAGIEVEAKRPLMSGFHAWFSVGGFVGALIGGQLLGYSFAPVSVISILFILVAIPFLWAQSRFDKDYTGSAEPTDKDQTRSWIPLPKGSVAIAAILCFIMFLAEGAILDWSSIFLVQTGKLPPERASLGYAAFAGAMMIFRFTGDIIIRKLGRPLVFQLGSGLAAIGLLIVVVSSNAWVALLGFALVGVGASNTVPILFSSISHQSLMSPAAALTAMTTFGYAGILMGPAFIGWFSDLWGMPYALGLVALSLIAVAALGTKIPFSREIKGVPSLT